MGRTHGPVCRLCRREGRKLLLKATRCETAKCPIEREGRNTPPGRHGWRRSRGSDYFLRLREKQRIKRYYGVWEKQFMRYFRAAQRVSGDTGNALLSLLERRLDNVLYKMGLAGSRKEARQFIVHGHVRVAGRKVDRPGYLVRPGDAVTIKDSEKSRRLIKSCQEAYGGRQVQDWLSVDPEQMSGSVLALPTYEHVQVPVDVNLIIEFCSR